MRRPSLKRENLTQQQILRKQSIENERRGRVPIKKDKLNIG